MLQQTPGPETGFTGLRQMNGYVQEEFLLELRGPEGRKRYREMYENSAIIGAVYQAISQLFRQFTFEWESVDVESPRAMEVADFFNGAFEDLDVPFADTIESNLSTLTFGWDIKERRLKFRNGANESRVLASKFDDGLVAWARFAERAQESSALYNPWKFSDDGSEILSWTQVDQRGETRTISADKFLHFRTTRAKNNPEGRSLLRNAWFSWYFFKRISEAEAIGISRDLTGIPVADVPADWFGENALDWQKQFIIDTRKTLLTIARGQNEGLIWPTAYDNQQRVSDIRLLTSGGKRQFDINQSIERYERRMAMVFLADLILMGHEATGSFALSDNKKGLLEVAIEGHAANFVGEYQKDAALIMLMNGWPLELSPRLRAKPKRAIDLGPLGDFVSKAVAAGFPWNEDKAIDDFLRDQGGLPRKTKAENDEDENDTDDDDADE